MSASQSGQFNTQEFTDLGVPLVGGRLYTFAYGTTTQKTAYTDHAGTIPHTYTSDGLGGQYIALNARGELPAPIYLAAGSYDLALKTAAGATVWTRRADPVWDIENDLSGTGGSSLVGYLPAGTGAVARTVQDELRETVKATQYGASTALADNSVAINKAATYLASIGGGDIKLGPGTWIVTATVFLPDNVHLVGSGQYSTVLKLGNSANTNIIQKKVGAVGTGAGLFNLTVDGNDANNTNGGIYWAGSSSTRGPCFTFEKVTVKSCRPIASPPSTEYGAILTTGSDWGVVNDCDFNQNQYAVGWWHKGSDWEINGLFLGPNGANYPCQSLIIQGGAGNRFSDCYFGGNGGLEQVLIWGASRNLFVNCVNDNAWQAGYSFQDSGGSSSSDNVFVGGQISSSGWKTNNTYSNVLIGGAAGGNMFIGVKLLGIQANKAKYFIEETDTASNNYIHGCQTDNNYGTNFDGRRAGSTTLISNVSGADSSEVQVLTAKKRVNVTGPYDAAAPSTASVPLLRLNNGGAVSLWAGSQGYANGWLQAIQDDGSNSLKQLQLNPLGGGVAVGGALTLVGTSGNSLDVTTGTANAAVAVSLGSVGPTGSTAGNPQGWLRVKVAGTDRFIPYW